MNNPVSKIFNDLSKNQKMSVMNLLTSIAVSDGTGPNPDREIQELNSFVEALNVHNGECEIYFKNNGYERIIEDLKDLSEQKLEFLVVCAWDLIICDGKPTQEELLRAGQLFEAIGVSDKKFVSIVQKSQAFMKKFT